MDGRKKEKVRRIYAWIAIVLFILLIVNLSTIQFQLGISLGIYVFIIMFYLFFLRKNKPGEDEANGKRDDGGEDKPLPDGE
ncbi:MAG: hypothetical protein JXB33_06515 [Clostridia bacterium]|nr:hypothetical protein [Clostridia bacterium]